MAENRKCTLGPFLDEHFRLLKIRCIRIFNQWIIVDHVLLGNLWNRNTWNWKILGTFNVSTIAYYRWRLLFCSIHACSGAFYFHFSLLGCSFFSWQTFIVLYLTVGNFQIIFVWTLIFYLMTLRGSVRGSDGWGGPACVCLCMCFNLFIFYWNCRCRNCTVPILCNFFFRIWSRPFLFM